MKKLYLTFVFLAVIAGIVVSQYFFDQNKAKIDPIEPLVLRSEVVKAADLGLHNAAADVAWLASIQYFGGRSKTNYVKLPEYLNLSANLDPKFSYPYAFGVLILPSINKTDQGIDLAKKGIKEAEPEWRIPYYLATTYHINKNDTKDAAYYFDLAANTKGAPDNVRKIAAGYGSRSDLRSQTEQIWEGIYESTDDEVIKERAKNYIIHFELLSFLEQAAQKYQTINGRLPAAATDLVPSVLKEIPADPFGFQYKFDETGRAVVQ